MIYGFYYFPIFITLSKYYEGEKVKWDLEKETKQYMSCGTVKRYWAFYKDCEISKKNVTNFRNDEDLRTIFIQYIKPMVNRLWFSHNIHYVMSGNQWLGFKKHVKSRGFISNAFIKTTKLIKLVWWRIVIVFNKEPFDEGNMKLFQSLVHDWFNLIILTITFE